MEIAMVNMGLEIMYGNNLKHMNEYFSLISSAQIQIIWITERS